MTDHAGISLVDAARGGFLGTARAPAIPPARRAAIAAMRAVLAPEGQRGKVLCAALALVPADRPRSPFATSDLVLRAWQEFREDFGLAHHEARHPDSGRVVARISDLVQRGLLARVAGSRLRVTPRGARWWDLVGRPWFAGRSGGAR